MGDRQGRGEIPSYRNVVMSEPGGGVRQGKERETNREPPVLGKKWQMGLKNSCLPKA